MNSQNQDSISNTSNVEETPLLLTPSRVTARQYITRELLMAYIQMFMVVRGLYAVILWLFIAIALSINYTDVVGEQPLLDKVCYWWLVIMEFISLVGITFSCSTCDVVQHPVTKIVYTLSYIVHMTVGYGLSIYLAVSYYRKDKVCMTSSLVIILSIINILRLIYYYGLFRNGGPEAIGAIDALDIRHESMLDYVKVDYIPGLSQVIGDNILTFPDDVEEDQCVICLESYKVNEKISILYCLHYYHSNCVEKWLSRVNNCPICRSTS